jgi:hypothetical protein
VRRGLEMAEMVVLDKDNNKIAKVGRPMLFPEPQDLENAFQHYIDDCIVKNSEEDCKNPVVPTITGFCRFMGISREGY